MKRIILLIVITFFLSGPTKAQEVYLLVPVKPVVRYVPAGQVITYERRGLFGWRVRPVIRQIWRRVEEQKEKDK